MREPHHTEPHVDSGTYTNPDSRFWGPREDAVNQELQVMGTLNYTVAL